MKKYYIIIFLLALFTPYLLSAQQVKLPTTAMGCPKVFYEESRSHEWEVIAKKHNWGTLSTNKWKVYIDRSGVKAYSSPSTASTVVNQTLEFMDEYWVAQEKDGFLLLYEDNSKNLTITKKAIAIGWVPVDHLLLWTKGLRNQNQIYRKAVILRDYDEIAQGDIAKSNPNFSKHPTKNDSTGWKASDLEFYFILKEENKNVLLFTQNSYQYNNKDARQLKYMKIGWIKKGFYLNWNTRACYEPNFDPAVKGKHAAVFKDENDAKNYRMNGTLERAIFDETLSGKRWKIENIRLPVMEDEGNEYIARVGTIGRLGLASEAADFTKWTTETKNKIAQIKAKIAKVNIVFVVDGTHSMVKYFKPMASALQNVMKQNGMNSGDINFGAVVYRNYADGNKLVESIQLTSDHKKVENWLSNINCESNGKTHYEAMLYGLNYAVDNMNWKSENANFIILVGDAANDINDKKGLTIDATANKMAKLGINLVAFQANHQNHDAYHDFPSQINKLMKNELSILTKKQIQRKDFKLTNQVYQYKFTQWPIYTHAFRYSQIDHSEKPDSLQLLVEDRVISFKQQANEELTMLEKALENTSTLTSEMEKVMIANGISKADIEKLRNSVQFLKVNGYTSMRSNGNQVFVPCVFITKTELDELIKSLQKVTGASDNLRSDLTNAMKDLALIYLGQNSNNSNQSVDEIMKAVTGLTKITGQKILQVNIKDIVNPNKVSDSEIEDFVNTLKSDIQRLYKIKKDCSLIKNGQTYYYILLDDMPLMPHENTPY